MTLGTWMKNYLYIPLGGNQVNNFKLYRNLIFVFLISGLWHGASWNFILWGAYHGLFLVLERLFLIKFYKKIGNWFSLPLTFIIVITGWVLFRNENINQGFYIIKQLYSFQFFDGKFTLNNDFLFMASLALLFSFFTITKTTRSFQEKVYGEQFSKSSQWLAVSASIILFYISLSFISALDFNPFIYFRF